jgi:putative toxin-antitoxin system antitoxin component (TIGR02293 family)
MIEAARVAEVLGGAKVLKRRVRSLSDLERSVAAGLPKGTLRNCVTHLLTDNAEITRFIYKVVPQGTYKRRRTSFTADESERIERLARLIAMAEFVWDDRDDARRFLLLPHPALDGRPPIDLAQSELGARRVEALLENILHGLPV